jgi:transcriptional regulator with XRE-family HTH domain
MRLLIEEYRRKAGLSQQELARRCDVSRTHISRLETEGTDILISTLYKIARALRVHPKDLIDWEDNTRE